MANGTKKNLTGGFGKLYTAPTGEPLPEIDDLTDTITISEPNGNWSPTGFTLDAHELRYSPEWEEEYVNERDAVVKLIKVRHDARFFLRFKERDPAHLNLAIACSVLEEVSAATSQTGQVNLHIGDGEAAAKSLLYLYTNEEGGSGIVHIPYAVAVGDVTLPWAKHPDPYDVEFRVTSNEDDGVDEEHRLLSIYHIVEQAT